MRLINSFATIKKENKMIRELIFNGRSNVFNKQQENRESG